MNEGRPIMRTARLVGFGDIEGVRARISRTRVSTFLGFRGSGPCLDPACGEMWTTTRSRPQKTLFL